MMSEARIIDGRGIAQALRRQIADDVAALMREHGVTPGLAVVLVGDDPASEIYVRAKSAAGRDVGMATFERRLPRSASGAELLALIGDLNRSGDVHGILVQLPLPPHIAAAVAIEAIAPEKDVDGLHPLNVGRLVAGGDAPTPCTPAGCLILAKSVRRDLSGLEAVIIGRSHIVGKPIAQLLLKENCTVTLVHSHTRDPAMVARRADVLVVAAGRPEIVRGSWIKPGAIVIDVGINRIAGSRKLLGDVNFAEARAVAGALTPVPGGVGPMTIACLLANTLEAARRQLSRDGPRR
jgi:methylenetetrahydrofolate dehydrogenase (NADP+)/methenyltetrahydrofolate cyclohydrolase